ncbi:tetratricopeptide repeat protein 4 homolog isoform X1 [Papaver somniferum]|uniref:tetratricopeptide repeat protein 4 homolog isoform X1 n=1 Tax=Papaver somniferum TaxID=3469 RepID=UPI000E6FDFE4|nr:tetratricopeptide repeat protein 4 homolog isoform X1 [Papaver somniferum]
MALLMEPGAEPLTENEKADLDAIAAIKKSSAFELKDKGNEYVKMGKKHYSDAIDCYTRAINQKALTDSDTSIVFSNRSHVNLLLGNYRRALNDAEEGIKLSPSNVKAHYRAAKAAFSLELFTEALEFCRRGLEHSPSNDELKKLEKQINPKILERENHDAQVSKAIAAAKNIVSAVEKRNLKIGKAAYQELTGMVKPTLDKQNILHWPVLLLYAEVMSSDFIEDFCEVDMFSNHLDMMFSETSPPLPWDTEHVYTRETIELYYEHQAGSGSPLSKTEYLRHLLEDSAGSLAESIVEEEKDASASLTESTSAGKVSVSWVKVNEKKMLHDVLGQPNFVIPGIPVFYVVSKCSSFYEKFKDGKWAPPP